MLLNLDFLERVLDQRLDAVQQHVDAVRLYGGLN
jgi:hypothetical protein